MSSGERPEVAQNVEWLVGGGRMGELIRSMDWAATPLGPRENWPQSLRTTINLCLTSNFPICFTWGADRIQIYNDGYWPMCGSKHPKSMGQDYRECWFSAWPVIGPGFERCMATGETTFVTDTRMFLDRNGYLEETFFTYSYSPIRDESGGIGGIFHPVTETTHLVLAQRRLSALRALAARSANSKGVDESLSAASEALSEYGLDLPFVLMYRLDGDSARLVGAAGVGRGNLLAVPIVKLDDATIWPIGEAIRENRPVVVETVPAKLGSVPNETYLESPEGALIFPISVGAVPRPLAVMIAGVSSRRLLDDAYRQFYDLLAGAVATILGDAFAHEEERRKAEALAELDRAKTVFFSNVSHEFRTPLTLMLGPLEDILNGTTGPVMERSREHVVIVHRNGLRLLKLVNALLDFSRLEAGRVQATFAPTDLAVLTADLASTFRSAVEKVGLTLAIDCPPLPQPVYVDAEMWEKIVLNLISNAFKFTPRGRIAVRQVVVGDFVELSVADTGVGIPPHELDRVFDRFHRIEGSCGRTYEGTGIGLALVQELVKLHAGSVKVESALGQGTTFFVTVGLGVAHLPKDRVISSQATGQQGLANPFVEEALRWVQGDDHASALTTAECNSKARILIADDNADMREYVTRLLSSAYSVTAVRDGEEALVAVSKSLPDLVLSDVMMPRLDGFGLLSKLRADVRTRSIPVVMLSARAGEEAKVEGLDAGADDYLIKPFSGKELVARVRATLETARLRQEAIRRDERECSLRDEAGRKDAFIAMLAHELRNPLGPIRNAVQMLGFHRDGEAADQAREIIGRQVIHLARIVDDLLEVSRITRGMIELRKERIDLAQLSLLVAGDEAASFESAGLTLEVKTPDIPLWVSGDRTRLTQIISNLLSNAVKFTERGGRVSLTVGGDRAEAVLSVSDTGIGIEPEFLRHLFETFTQADKTLDRRRGGLGLGLSLVKGLAELHGGSAEAESSGTGRGTTFRIRLPRLEEPVALKSTSISPSAVPVVKPGRVLIVEDNRDAADILQLLLQLSGCQVRVAYTGPDGVTAAKEMVPDLVICDIGLPGISGYEVARQLRIEFGIHKPHLVALTGYGSDSDREEARAAGFDRHFTKPVDPVVIENLLVW